jgi:hypothetical protein
VSLRLYMSLVCYDVLYYQLTQAAVANLQLLSLKEVYQAIGVFGLQTNGLLSVLNLYSLDVVY